MSHTFVEKILVKNAGLSPVTPGQIIDATPDVALNHNNSASFPPFAPTMQANIIEDGLISHPKKQLAAKVGVS